MRYARRSIAALLPGIVLAACAHTAGDSSLREGLAPFSATRTQAIGIVANTKASLGADDINAVAAAYTSLQEKANAYAGFMIEAVTASSFDRTRNATYAGALAGAISAFDGALAGLGAKRAATVPAAWVTPFAQTLATRWDRYAGDVSRMSPQAKAELIAEIKRGTVWPNYEDIATEPVAVTR
jgi:hypothetical protein